MLDDKIEESIALGLEAVKCVLDGDIDTEIFGKRFLQK